MFASSGFSDQPLALLDLGTSQISCWIVKVGEQRDLKRLSEAKKASVGIRSGRVRDLEALSEQLASVLEEAEQKAKVTLKQAILAVPGSLLRVAAVEASVVPLGVYISSEDVRRLEAQAALKISGEDNHILHVFPHGFRVDDQKDITNPKGMEGTQVLGRFSVVYAPKVLLKNMLLAAQRAHVQIIALVAAPYALAKTGLSSEEKGGAARTVLVDMGAGGTDVTCFKEGVLEAVEHLPLGGMHMTHDIAYGLDIPRPEAERLKILQGSCMRSSGGAFVHKGGEALDLRRSLARENLCDILRPRAAETLEAVLKVVQKQWRLPVKSLRFVLGGGGSLLSGMPALASQMWGRPVRHLEGELHEERRAEEFSVLYGLFLFLQDVICERSLLSQGFLRKKSVLRQILTWLRKNL